MPDLADPSGWSDPWCTCDASEIEPEIVVSDDTLYGGCGPEAFGVSLTDANEPLIDNFNCGDFDPDPPLPTPTATATPTNTPATPTATASSTATPTANPNEPTGTLARNWRIFR
jgi:hypothetical protein